MIQVGTPDVVHDQEMHSPVFGGIDGRHQIRVLDPPGSLDFTLEAHDGGAVGERRRQYFECAQPPCMSVAHLENHSHPALAKFIEDLVIADQQTPAFLLVDGRRLVGREPSGANERPCESQDAEGHVNLVRLEFPCMISPSSIKVQLKSSRSATAPDGPLAARGTSFASDTLSSATDSMGWSRYDGGALSGSPGAGDSSVGGAFIDSLSARSPLGVRSVSSLRPSGSGTSRPPSERLRHESNEMPITDYKSHTVKKRRATACLRAGWREGKSIRVFAVPRVIAENQRAVESSGALQKNVRLQSAARRLLSCSV